MGRKIPAKKHRGVKDPLLQQAKRQQSLKGKINAPPKDPDEQPVPRSLERLFAFQNRDKTDAKHRKKRPNKNIDTAGAQTQKGAVSRLQRLPGETPRAFSLRINSAVRALHRRPEEGAEDIEEEDSKGARIAALRSLRARRNKRGANTETAPAGGDAPRLSRAQRRNLKLKEKQKAAQAARAADRRPSLEYERVRFGEVAHAPPMLPPPRLKKQGVAGAGAGAGAGERARLQAVAAYRMLRAAQAAARDQPRAQ